MSNGCIFRSSVMYSSFGKYSDPLLFPHFVTLQPYAQLFSGLSRDVQSGSSPGSGWATQGNSEACPEDTPTLS